MKTKLRLHDNRTYKFAARCFASGPLWFCAACFSAMAALVSGCATSATQPGAEVPDQASVARSKTYVDGLNVIASANRDSRIGVCVVPRGLGGRVKDAAAAAAAAKDASQSQSKVVAKTTDPLAPSKVWRDLLGRANTCVNEKNWNVLETLATEMAKADIDSPWPAYFLSLEAEAKGDHARAMWMVGLALKKSGEASGLFVYQRARIWLGKGEPAKAVADFQKAVALEPRLYDGQLYLAEVFTRDLEPEKAISYYQEVLKLNAKSFVALTGLGELMIVKGDGARAAEYYSSATQVQPNKLQPWLRLAYIYENLQKNPELALGTYKGLKAQVDSGAIHDKIDLDYNTRIKTLEESLKPRQPAQASAAPNEKSDSTRRLK